MTMPVRALEEFLAEEEMSQNLLVEGRQLAARVGVPYLAECERDGPRGPRRVFYDGDRAAGSLPGELLPGAIDNAPESALTVSEALSLLEDEWVTGLYGHILSQTLVVVTASGKRVGIRCGALVGRVEAFQEGLTACLAKAQGAGV